MPKRLLLCATFAVLTSAGSCLAAQVPGASGPPPVCRDIAQIANAGQLADTLTRARDEPPVRIPDSILSYQHFVGRLTLPGGAQTYVWDLGETYLGVYSSTLESLPIVQDPDIDASDDERYRWAHALGIHRFDGADYVVWGDVDTPEFITRIERDLRHSLVCEFGTRHETARRIAQGEAPVCEAARAATLEYPRFDEPASVGTVRNDGVEELVARDQAARVDIDNDGTPELVVQLRFETARGEGCARRFLATIDDQRTALAGGPLQELLGASAGECGSEQNAFRFDGRTYLEVRGARSWPHRTDTVSEIVDGQLRERCRIESLPVSYVVTPYDAFVRTAKATYRDPWELAMERVGVEHVKLLLANHHPAAKDRNLLTMAMSRERFDVLELLLAAGLDPNAYPRDGLSPLREAIRFDQPHSFLKLLAAGAKPEIDPAEAAAMTGAAPVEGRKAVHAYVKAYGWITPELILGSALSDPLLLAELDRSRARIRGESVSWHNGRLRIVPQYVEKLLSAKPEALAIVARMLARAEVPPVSDMDVTYDAGGLQWWLMKPLHSQMTNEEFLWFATGFCVHFLSGADCGPPQLVKRSAAWLERISLPCRPGRTSSELDAPACKLAMEYARLVDNLPDEARIGIFRLRGDDAPIFQKLVDLCDLFAQSRVRR